METTERNKLDYRNGNIRQLFFKLFFPTLIAMVSNSVLNICDGMFVGHGVGPDALAAINIVAPYFMLCIGIGLMLGFGASVIGSIRLAENNVAAARLVMTRAYVSGMVVFALIILFSFIFLDPILIALGSSERLLDMARSYLLWLLPGFFFFYLQCVGMMLIRLDGSPKYAMSVQVVAAVLNIFLDWLMVFPLGMGITGASIATSFSLVVGGTMVVVYFLFFSDKIRFCSLGRGADAVRGLFRSMADMSKIGFATFLSEIAIGAMMVAGNYMFMQRLGEAGVAAFSVGCYLFPIMFSISNAVAQSAQPIISFNYGARCRERVDSALRLALVTSVAAGIAISAGMWFGSGGLASVFLPSGSEAWSIAVGGLPLVGLSSAFFAVNITYIGYYQSTEQVVVSTAFTLLRGIVLVIPAFIVLPMIVGNPGLWLSIPVAEALTLGAIIAFRSLRKSR